MNIFSSASFFAESVLAYEDCVTKSGILPEIYYINVEPASDLPVYDLLFRDTDPTTNSSSGSAQAKRNFAKCEGALGFIINGRFRQLAGPPIAYSKKKNKGFGKTEELEPRKYHQPYGKPLEIFFPRVTVKVWKAIAAKNNLSMPEFPAVGLKGEALGFWEWVEVTNCPVILTEGEKKALALISRGYAAIGLPGINTGYRVTERGETVTNPDGTTYQRATARELHEALQKFDTPGREITILFDYRDGDYSESPEFRAATTTAKLVKSAIAKIAQLSGPDKGVDDFCVADGDINTVISAAQSFDEIQKQILKGLSKKNREKAWTLTHPVAWECNQRRLNIPYPSSGLICIKSPKDTGKTYALKQLVAKAQAEGRKVLIVTHRIALGRAICSVVEIPWIEEMNSDADRKIEGKFLGHGLCIDSLHPTSQALFDPKAYEGALVIFDEVEQIFWHALNSSTCRENRQAILASLKILLQTVLNSGGQVLVQDADLSDISIDFIQEFSRVDVKPWVAVNHWQPSEPWKIKFYDTQQVKGGTKDDPSGLLKDAVDCVNGGGKIWFSVDSQKAKSKHGSKILEKYFQSRCPGKKILRIDAETVANPEHPAYQCAEKINELLKHYDIVICSPSLATGVSIEKNKEIEIDVHGHFTAVFGIFQGAISDNEVRQSLARVREPVPRFVWCRQIAVGKIGNGESNYKDVAKSTEKDVRYNLQLLKDFEFDLDKGHNPIVLKYWAKFAARINSSVRDFRETVREGLEAEGHILTDCGDDDRDTSGEIKALRILNQVGEAVAVAEAEDIDRKEFEELEQKRSKTDAERYQEEKFRLREIYKTKVTAELRQLHQDKWYSKILLEYLLTHNPDFVLMRDRKNIDSQIKSGDGQLCLQDVRQITAKLKIHEILNTLQFCDRTKEWSNKSPEILEFAGKALKFAADMKIFTGITVSPKKVAENPIGIVQSFLAQLGLKLTGEQRRVGEERVRFYKFGGAASANIFDRAGNKIGEPQGLRAEIFEQWKERDELALFEFQQNGIAAVEADVTLDLKPSASKVRLKKDVYLGSVTPRTIDIENIPSVTTDPSIETPIEPTAEPTGKMGWVSRWGKWVRASFVATTDGAQFRILIQEVTGWNEVFAWPHQLRWDEGQA